MKDARFPKLTHDQVERLRAHGSIDQYEEATNIFLMGDNLYDFFVILQGSVKIHDPTSSLIIVNHGKYEFTGDSGMLSNRASLFNAEAAAGTVVLRIHSGKLQSIISENADISDILLNAFLLRQQKVLNEISGGPKLIGSGKSPEIYKFRDFMEKNHIWHTFLDIDTDTDALELLSHFQLDKDDLPILINSSGKLCKQPTIDQLARHSGVLMDFEDKVFDVLVIGAGPAGLAASVYAASEGLGVVTIDGESPGGQAGKSSKIENYLGFPTGISGGELANRAYIQAQKFGCSISIPHSATDLSHDGDCFTVMATNNKTIRARSVIVATGAKYRRLPVENLENYEGSGVYYSATGMDVHSCKDQEVVVVGGGNSAGQAAMFLADHASLVHVMIRGNDLGSKMSDYLVQRLRASDKVKIHLSTQITEMRGAHHLESITVATGVENRRMDISNVFSFIGASPQTSWLGKHVAMDDKGFIVTGSDLRDAYTHMLMGYINRDPAAYESSIAGLFAVGDVRHNSVKRVASAVGEGSVVISKIHRYLAERS